LGAASLALVPPPALLGIAGGPVARVGIAVTLVGEVVALVSGPLALVGEVIAFVGGPPTTSATPSRPGWKTPASRPGSSMR
jgi:hypothetical protein